MVCRGRLEAIQPRGLRAKGDDTWSILGKSDIDRHEKNTFSEFEMVEMNELQENRESL